jgi:hypothetical protein
MDDPNDQEAILYRFELLCDLNDHFKFNHSISGHASLSSPDILIFSFLRRYMDLNFLCIEQSLNQVTSSV